MNIDKLNDRTPSLLCQKPQASSENCRAENAFNDQSTAEN